MINLHLRFYEELNDFLPVEKRKVAFDYHLLQNASINDVIEAMGVPHTEVELILVNGKSVDFNYQVKDGDFISVYPMFEALDVTDIIHLRPKPLRKSIFILDVHLGKLARYLRLLGFDVAYENNFSDETIATRSQNEKRIVLTRDVGLLKHNKITRGYWIRHTDPEQQTIEVLKKFDLYRQCNPFTSCLECGGLLAQVEKKEIVDTLLPETKQYYESFMKCQDCQRIYWEGTHYLKLKKLVEKFTGNKKPA